MPDNSFFKSISPLSLEEVAKIGGADILRGDKAAKIKSVAPIDAAGADDITFLSNKKYADALKSSKAGFCILSEKSVDNAPETMALLVSDNPYASYAKIATAFYPDIKPQGSVSDGAHISASAKIGEGATIEAGAYVGDGASIGNNCYIASGAYIGNSVQIGNNCRIAHGVTLINSIVGNDVIIHAGVSVGQDGFGFATEGGVHIKVPQLGRVIIKDYVEIGANSCIDRGAGPDTIIGEGTKIDNLVQIGHNVQTGKGCIIVSHVGISGSTKLGDYVVLGGQVGVAGHLNIGSMVNVAAQSGVINNLKDGDIVGGSPAIPVKQWRRQTIAIKNLVKKKG